MAPKKLTEADKAVILGLYRQPEETTSTLAERYGVSNSTISRLLKASLPEADYKALIQQKRGGADKDTATGAPAVAGAEVVARPAAEVAPLQSSSLSTTDLGKPEVSKAPPILKKRITTADVGTSPAAPSAPAPISLETAPEGSPPGDPGQFRWRRSRSAHAAARDASVPLEDATQLSLSTNAPTGDTTDAITALPEPSSSRPRPVKKVVAKAQDPSPEEDWATTTAPLGDDYNDDDEDDDYNDDDWDGDTSDMAPHLEVVEIVPLTPSDIPSQCYLVVERLSSELVVLPLKTFASLGQIPEEEGNHRTLPVFDNHRVARRFSRRNQRVIKVPDGNLLQTTRPYLQAKGITRLLIDGHVFTLEDKAVEAPV
jgi:transposase-like protein